MYYGPYTSLRQASKFYHQASFWDCKGINKAAEWKRIPTHPPNVQMWTSPAAKSEGKRMLSQAKAKFGGEVFSSDVLTHKGHSMINSQSPEHALYRQS